MEPGASQGSAFQPWMSLVSGMWLLSSNGLTYAFAIYSPSIKEALGYNQKEIEIIAVAKDIGNSSGLLAAFLFPILPSWVIIAIGALQSFCGYGGLWLIVTKKVEQPSIHVVMFLMWLGVNSATYFNTAVLVNCLNNFPFSRGKVVGILKGLVGLGSAIYAQIYSAAFAPNRPAFLLLVAAGPSIPALLAMVFLVSVQPSLEQGQEEEEREKGNFDFFFKCVVLLMLFLLAAILISTGWEISRAGSQLAALGMVLLLLAPLWIPLRQLRSKPLSLDGSMNSTWGSSELTPILKAAKAEDSDQLEEVVSQTVTTSERASAASLQRHEARSQTPESLPPASHASVSHSLASTPPPPVKTPSQAAITPQLLKTPVSGHKIRESHDSTLLEAMAGANFWLLMFSMTCGAGTALTVINNLAQIGQAQGVEDMRMPVALISVWNCSGRIGGGYLSEYLLRKYGIPRPLVVAWAQGLMTAGHLLLAFAVPGSVYLGSLLVGLTYGVTFGMFTTCVSEVFGMAHFSAIYNVFTVAMPVGSVIFSGGIAGYVYDMEAQKDAAAAAAAASSTPISSSPLESLVCRGAHCFRMTFVIMAGACALAIVASVLLAHNTRHIYRRLYPATGSRHRWKEGVH